MFNYANGFPIVEARPSAGMLTINAFKPVQVGALYNGDNAEIIDPEAIFDGNNWTRADIKRTETYNEFFALSNILQVEEGSLTGISNFVGVADEPLKFAYLRQMVGKDPLKPWKYGDWELTPEALETDKQTLRTLLTYVEQNPEAAKLKDISDRAKELSAKLLYAEAQENANRNLKFNVGDLITAQNWLGLGDPEAGSSKDIEARLSAYDPNFNPRDWFATKFSDEVAELAMLENGISADTINNSPNADHAMFKIMSMLNRGTIQRRMSTYELSTLDNLRLFRDTIVSGMLNNPGEIAFGATVELGLAGIGALAGSMVAPVAGTAGGAAAGAAVGTAAVSAIAPAGSLFLRLKRAYDAASVTGKVLRTTKYAAETLYKMPLGVMPSYVANYGLLRSTLATTAFGAVQGFAAEAARQQREIAFGAATMYANPYAMSDYNVSAMASSALETGLVFGATFGLGGNLLRTGFGAVTNRLSGVLIDPDSGMRVRSDKSWSLSGTPLGKTIDNFKAKFERPIMDRPVPEKLAKEAAMTGENITPERLVSETEARVNRVETQEALASPEAARATPADVGTRRYEGESIPQYLARMAPAKAITNPMEFFNNLARRTTKAEGESIIGLSDNYTQMNYSDQLSFLMDAEAHIAEARKIETEAVGLSRDRQRVYEEIELSRKAQMRQLKRKMPAAQWKMTMETRNNKTKRSQRGIPELLRTVQDKAVPVAQRKAAALEAAMNILEAAQNAAKNKDKAEDIRAKLPEQVSEVMDVAVVEQKLNGGVISENTMDDIFTAVTGDTPKSLRKPNKLQQAIRRANIMARFDTERLAKIKEIIDAPEKFLDVVKGNRETAEKFFNFLNDSVNAGVLTPEDRLLVLASTVHLNFEGSAFSLNYAFAELPKGIAGRFDKDSNTLIVNNTLSATAASDRSKKVASTILHEIGHAYFRHRVNGDIYQEALKAFNRLHSSEKLDMFSLVHKTSNDPLLNENFGLYYFQNMEELMVESWSKILLTEGEAAITTLKPHEATITQVMLNKVLDNLALVAQMFDNSEFYHSSKKVMDLIINLDEKLDKTISVSKLYDSYTEAETKIADGLTKAQQYKAFTEALEAAVPNARERGFIFTAEEFDMWYSTGFTDSALRVALVMSKSMGKELINNKGVTKDFPALLTAYQTYKEAQMGSIKVKLGFLLGSTDYVQLVGKTKEERLDYLDNYLFSNFSGRVGIGTEKTKMLPVTYQEDHWHWNSSGINLLNAIDNLNITPESAISKTELETFVDGLRQNMWFNSSPIEILRQYMNAVGLTELSNLAVSGAHRRFFREAEKNGGIFNMENSDSFPEWSTKEIVKNNLEFMLTHKVTLDQLVMLAKVNVSSEIIDAFTRVAKTPEKMVEMINAAIETGKLDYDYNAKTWKLKSTEVAKPTKKTKKKAPTKKKKVGPSLKEIEAKAKEAADKVDSEVVTEANLVSMLALLANKGVAPEGVSRLFVQLGALKKMITSGKLQTLEHLANLARKAKKRERLNEIREQQQAIEAARGAASVVENEAVRFRLRRDAAVFTKAETRQNMFSIFAEYNKELNGILLTTSEADTLRLLIEFSTDESLGEHLKVSRATAQRMRKALAKKLIGIVSGSKIENLTDRAEILTSLKNYMDSVNKAADESGTAKPKETVKARLNKSKTEKTKPTPKEAAAAAVVLLDAARSAKLEAKDPTPVPTLKTEEPSEGTLFRATSEVTGNKAEDVLRPEKQVDALVDKSTMASKESVNFVPRNPIKTKVKYNGALPNKIEKLKANAIERGNDAIIFDDGVVMPLATKELEVTGKVDINAEPNKPTEAVLVKENGIPTRKIRAKTKKTTKKEDAPMVVNKLPAKDGEPATARETVAMPEETVTPDIVPTTAPEKLERQTNMDAKLLRANGMDSSFLRLFTERYWRSGAEPDAATTLTDGFKAMWTQFVLVNQYIANANRLVLGEDIMQRFWDAVDRIQTEQLGIKVGEGPGGTKLLTYSQILQKAAKEVTPEGKPDFVVPLTPDNIRFIKADAEGNYRLGSKSKMHQNMIDLAGTEPKVAAPPVPASKVVTPDAPSDAVPATPVTGAVPPAPAKPTKAESIARAIGNSEDNASLLIRENTVVGRVFGGSQRESRNWWRDLMNGLVNTTQKATQLGNTLRSMLQPVAFVTRFFDDTKAQTGHLVAAGKEAHSTAMHMRGEESRLILSVFRPYSRLHSLIPRKLRATITRPLDFLIYDARRQNKSITTGDLTKIGIPAYLAKDIATQANAVLKATYEANKAILDLETETGRIISVDSNGNPLDSGLFAPTQVDHEMLAGLTALQQVQLIRDLATARTKRKLKDPTLDQNTMVVMGWLDVNYDPKSKTASLFAPDRTFNASQTNNMFSPTTLDKLRIGFVEAAGIVGDRATVLKMLNIADPENYFVHAITDPTTGTLKGYDIHRIPKTIDDLAPEDAARYREALQGNIGMYAEKWRQKLKDRNLIEVEIEELMKQKTRQYPYDKANMPDSIFKQAFFRLAPEDGEVVLPIRGLTPEEFMETDLTKSILRTNMAEAYFFFLQGRYFELAFQKQLNKLMGRTDVMWDDVLDYTHSNAVEKLKDIAVKNNWTEQERQTALQDIALGIQRIREEYQFNANTLPYLTSEASGGARIALSLMRIQLSPGFGISALGETMGEIIKQSPDIFSIPRNILTLMRYTFGDLRLSKNRMLESDLGDMVFVLENFRTDLANRFMGEFGYGAFRSDSRLGTKLSGSLANIRNGSGLIEKSIRTAEEAARYAQSIGSLQAVTNATRAMAKVRLQKFVWKYVKNGKLEKLMTVLSDPKNKDILDKLRQEAMTSPKAERELLREFARITRHEVGMPGDEAALFLKYGLTTTEQIRHLKWVMDQTGRTDGRVDVIKLEQIQRDLYNNPVSGIDPETLKSAISAYGLMIEDLITKEAVSESKGLNKITNLDSKGAFGRVWYALSSWIRSYQDNVILDFGSRSMVGYMFSSIFLWLVMDTFIGIFKEYLAGREVEDILAEFEEQPEQLAIRGISRVPFLGVANGIVEAAAYGVSKATGGSYRYYGVPLLPPGPSATMQTVENTWKDFTSVAGKAVFDQEFDIKAFSNLMGASTLVNRSGLAIPIRLLEDNNAFQEYDAIQRYLDTVHRDPYPYKNRSISRRPQINVPTPELPPRNYLLERKEALEAQQKQEEMKTSIQFETMNLPTGGVSKALGDLLEDNR